eukprot:3163480-Prymnesium_polylepis.1
MQRYTSSRYGVSGPRLHANLSLAVEQSLPDDPIKVEEVSDTAFPYFAIALSAGAGLVHELPPSPPPSPPKPPPSP